MHEFSSCRDDCQMTRFPLLLISACQLWDSLSCDHTSRARSEKSGENQADRPCTQRCMSRYRYERTSQPNPASTRRVHCQFDRVARRG